MKRNLLILITAAALLISGCATGPTVTRTASDEVIDLSGRWNDTDSRLTAEAMVSSMLSGGWLERFSTDEGRPPVVIVGSVRNKSSEHIDAETFIKDIERELINSGRVTFVAAGAARDELRDEREDQQSNATQSTAAALAAETGADYMMQGVITSQTDAIQGKRATLYKVDMELIGLENNQKVWIDTKEIKKLVEQKKNSW
ncbi:MAG: penicillin-binding protein activator LpoB [Spirochaetes bacterium]|nr:MAG: penicillin-binding protein activator LpoB [Spirochaetota bacterium]